MRAIRLAALAAATCLATPAFAQTDAGRPVPDAGTPPPETSGDSLTIGAAGVYLPDYEGARHNHFTPAPGALGSYHGFNFTLAGDRLSVDLIPNAPGPGVDVEFGPIGVVNFNRSSLKSIDDLRVRALGKRDTAIELGGYVGIGKTGVITSDYDRLSVTVSYRHDVAGAHEGSIWQPTISYLTPLSHKAAVGLTATAEHASDRYAHYYFDVDGPQSLASGLPVYGARGGWKNYTLGALGTVALTGDLLHGFKLVGGGTYAHLLNDFGRSPLTSIAGRRSQWTGILGLAYTF